MAASAPTIMVTLAAPMHMTVAVAMPASHLDDGVVLRGKRRNPSLAEADAVIASVDASSAAPIRTRRFMRFPPIA